MTATSETHAVRDYVDAVRAELDDLPDAERADLLEDLETHLAEVAAEEPSVPLANRLGEPATYAAELRAAAGLPVRTARHRSAVRRRAATLVATARRTAAGRAVLDFLPELRPAWWVLRGYLVVTVPAYLLDGSYALPLPDAGGSRFSGLLLIGVAVVLSVAWARRGGAKGRLRPVGRLANVALGVAALLVLADVADRYDSFSSYSYHEPVYFLDASGRASLVGSNGAISNIYPYDEQGRPLTNVQLFDQNGQPIEATVPGRFDLVRSYPTTSDGRPVTNAYPQHVAERDPFGELRPQPRPTPTPYLMSSPSPSPSPSTAPPSPSPSTARPSPSPS